MKPEIFVVIALFIIGASATCGPHETKFRIKRCDRVCNSDKQLCAPKDSKQKCFCKLGFQRLTNDFAAACVRSKDCVKCDENQEYKVCGPLCPEHCGKPDDTKCEEKCVKGCFCKESYVLESKASKKCILKTKCPTTY